MELADKYLPDYSFREVHALDIAADPVTVIEAAAAHRPEADSFARAMIALRELPIRLARRFRGGRSAAPPPFGQHNFLLLEKQEGRGLAYGLAGRFWRADYGLVPLSGPREFLAFDRPGAARLVFAFSARPLAGGGTRLVTETRVSCPDRACRMKFAPYWYLIRPVSGLIRRRTLAAVRRMSERQPPPGRP